MPLYVFNSDEDRRTLQRQLAAQAHAANQAAQPATAASLFERANAAWPSRPLAISALTMRP